MSKNFTVPFLKYKSLKLKLRVILYVAEKMSWVDSFKKSFIWNYPHYPFDRAWIIGFLLCEIIKLL